MPANLAIVIPAFNEGKTIARVARAAAQHGRVIVVSDGSTDATAKIAREEGAEVVENAVNLGYDASLNRGFERALALGCRYVLTLDADGQHPIEQVPEFLQLLEAGAEVVAGVRPEMQRISEKLFAWFALFRFGLQDPLCGMKGYRVETYRRLGHFDSYLSVGTELLLFAARHRLKVAQIPIAVHPRPGASRFGRTLKAEWRIFRAMVIGMAGGRR